MLLINNVDAHGQGVRPCYFYHLEIFSRKVVDVIADDRVGY